MCMNVCAYVHVCVVQVQLLQLLPVVKSVNIRNQIAAVSSSNTDKETVRNDVALLIAEGRNAETMIALGFVMGKQG